MFLAIDEFNIKYTYHIFHDYHNSTAYISRYENNDIDTVLCDLYIENHFTIKEFYKISRDLNKKFIKICHYIDFPFKWVSFSFKTRKDDLRPDFNLQHLLKIFGAEFKNEEDYILDPYRPVD